MFKFKLVKAEELVDSEGKLVGCVLNDNFEEDDGASADDQLIIQSPKPVLKR